MKPIVALVDCNNFYVSCERVFQPALWDRPVVVLSNNDGCIIARSNEVKALGIAMGTPYFKCKDILRNHDVAVFSSNYTLYGDMSRRVMDTLAQFTPDLEIYSIDEAFLSLAGFETGTLTAYARTIRKTVRQWTAIPVSIGIASTRTLAKIAAYIAKKNPDAEGIVNLLDHADIDEILETIPAGEIWGIGRRKEAVLKRYGIHAARQFKHAHPAWIRKQFTITGLRTQRELWGEACIPLEETPPPKKQIVCSRSFGKPVASLEELREAVAEYAEKAAFNLRRQRSAATILQVFITTNRFADEPQYSNAVQVELPRATADTLELVEYACRALEKIYRENYRYKKAGVILMGFVADNAIQENFFVSSRRTYDSERLMSSIDYITGRYGAKSIQVASAGIEKKWQMQRSMKSFHYTTDWHDLPVVKATEL